MLWKLFCFEFQVGDDVRAVLKRHVAEIKSLFDSFLEGSKGPKEMLITLEEQWFGSGIAWPMETFVKMCWKLALRKRTSAEICIPARETPNTFLRVYKTKNRLSWNWYPKEMTSQAELESRLVIWFCFVTSFFHRPSRKPVINMIRLDTTGTLPDRHFFSDNIHIWTSL